MKHLSIVFLLLCISLPGILKAQQAQRSYKGRVLDSAGLKPLADATVSIFRARDSMLLNFAFTTPNGNFSVSVRSKDSLLIIISLQGYQEHILRDAVREEGWVYYNYGDIRLTALPLSFKGVTVRSSAIRMNGDTIEINAGRFKVLPGSDVAQLFKKIPGFEVNVKGEIKVNGSSVSKIRVDGSDFFGNNPGLVSKNLNADMVETVQVYEERNPDGSGSQDGSKVINLKLKKGKRNGLFGDLLAGGGSNERYESGIRLNDFKNDRKFSFIVNSSNNNGTGFDFGFGNWHRARSGERNGAGEESFFGYSPEQGQGNINHRSSGGLTYFNEFSGKRKLSASLYANRNEYQSFSYSESNTALNDSLRRLSKDSSDSRGLAMGGSLELNYSDETDSTGGFELGISTSVSDHQTHSDGMNRLEMNSRLLNRGISTLNSTEGSESYKINGSYRRMLRKNRKYYISLSSYYRYGRIEEQTRQYMENSSDTFNNLKTKDNTGAEFLSKISMGMPLKGPLMLNLSADRWQKTTQTGQIYRNAENRYSSAFEQNYIQSVDSLSVRFGNRQVQYSLKPYLSVNGKQFHTQGGITLLHLNMNNTRSDSTGDLNRNYLKWLPFYSLSYYTAKTYLYLTVSKSSLFPQSTDLLPVLDLSNNYERLKGNPNLKPTDVYSFRTYGSIYKIKGFRFFYFGSEASRSDNAKIWVRQRDENGILYKSPENASGKRNISGWISASRKLGKVLSFDLSVSAGTDREPMITEGLASSGQNRYLQLTPGLNFSYSDSLDITLNMRSNTHVFHNSLNPGLDYRQNLYWYALEGRALLPFGAELRSSLEVSDQRKIPGIGKIIPVWSVFVQQSLSAQSPFSLKLTLYDILNRNTDISRQAADNVVYTSQSNRLQRYFMLTLVYKIRKVGAAESEEYVY